MVLTAIPGAALAQYLPAPDPVPDGIAAPERQSLDAQYELLLELWANLDPSISEHEGRCTSVDTRDSALMAACAESEALLSASIDDYFGTMAEYESQLAAAKAAALAQAEAEAERRRIEEARPAEAHIDVPSRRQNPLEEWVWANWSKAPNYITIDPNLLRDPIRLREWMHNPAVADKIRRWYTDATQETAWQKLKNGSYFGTGTGADSAQWYADQYAATGSWYYGAGGLFSSLWMPDTYLDTALTLGPVVVGAAAGYLSLGARGVLGTRAVTGVPRGAAKVAEHTYLYVTKGGKTIEGSKLTLLEAEKLYKAGEVVGRRMVVEGKTVGYWDFATGRLDILTGPGYGPVINRAAQRAMEAGIPPERILKIYPY